jgi:hypothetical protein
MHELQPLFKTQALRSLNTRQPVVYVIVGDGDHAGHVKTIRCGPTQSTSLLDIKWVRKHKRNAEGELTGTFVLECQSVEMKPEMHARGWRLMRECYLDEGRPKALEAWYSFQAACRTNRSSIDTGIGSLVPGFPDELLPKYCREIREKRAAAPKWAPSAEALEEAVSDE